MQQTIKKYLWVVLMAAGLETSWGFALNGPILPSNGADAWQTAVIGYQLAYGNVSFPGSPNFLGDIGGPRDIGQEYRRNVPVIYYTYDSTFLEFFGSNGVVAVDSAVAIMNSLTNADQENLSSFPLDSQHFNPTAQALYLTDLKSTTLHLLVEQMGLASPTRFTWTLHDRYLAGGTCPVDEEYLVVQRNYADTNTSLTSVQYSPYVNNVLYTYGLGEICNSPVNPLAITFPYSVDPLADQYTAVADNTEGAAWVGGDVITGYGLQIGGYYNNLTADDVAGIDYMLSTNRINWERVSSGVAATTGGTSGAGSYLIDISTNSSVELLFPTNAATPTGYGTFNLGALLTSAATNAPALLPALFPGVVVASSQNYFILATNVTVTSYYTNYVGSAYGSAPVLVLVTNYTYVPRTQYVTTFANVFTNYYSSNTTAILQTITTGALIGGTAGSVATTTNYQKVVLKNVPSGSFYVLPQSGGVGNAVCPPGILYTLQTNVLYTTNLITITATNVATTTTTTGTNLYSYSQYLITWYTNYTYVTYAVNCTNDLNATGLYEGIGKVQFVREDYDSLLGQFFQPVTNYYTMTAITNSRAVTQHFVRVVTAPEIILTAADDGLATTFNGTVTRTTPNWDESQLVAGGVAGPGVFNSSSTLQYNDIGTSGWNDFFLNGIEFITPTFFDPSELNQTNLIQSLAWASFDSSTNEPIVYPNGTSLANLASQALIQITPSSVPPGTNGVPYSVQFSAVAPRLTAPFTWSATGLPVGLSMSSGGLLSGTPVDQTGGANAPLVYDFTLILTDSLSHSVQWSYPITIQ